MVATDDDDGHLHDEVNDKEGYCSNEMKEERQHRKLSALTTNREPHIHNNQLNHPRHCYQRQRQHPKNNRHSNNHNHKNGDSNRNGNSNNNNNKLKQILIAILTTAVTLFAGVAAPPLISNSRNRNSASVALKAGCVGGERAVSVPTKLSVKCQQSQKSHPMLSDHDGYSSSGVAAGVAAGFFADLAGRIVRAGGAKVHRGAAVRLRRSLRRRHHVRSYHL